MISVGIAQPDQLSTSLPTSSSYIHQPTPRSPPKHAHLEPSFICTICWQPQYPPLDQSCSGSRFGPKLLGTSARIVCHACWSAVLDLSICWVCGECIVRGDEVISLGWCFWHRRCFGCLICGTKITPPSHDDDDILHKRKWRSCDGSDCGIGESRKRKRCAGVELEEIPLCDICESEMGGDSQHTLLGQGLETVTRFDGGLSRNRLERFSEQQAELRILPRQLARRPRRIKGATGIESELGRFINRSSTASGNASETCCIEDRAPLILGPSHGISEDGSFDKRIDEGDMTEDKNDTTQAKPTLYVSVFDPIGDPPFKPSPTKPLPMWMSLLPTNVHAAKETNVKPVRDECPDSKLSQEFIKQARSDETIAGDLASVESSGSYGGFSLVQDLKPFESRSKTRSVSATSPIDIPRPKRRATTSISFNQEELDGSPRSSKRSQTMEPSYGTPLELSTKLPRYRRHPTPFPRISSPEIGPDDYFTQSVSTSSTTTHFSDTVHEMALSEFEKMTSSPETVPMLLSSPKLVHSGKYLDQYQPLSLSVPLQDRPQKVEPFMKKLKRQRSEKRSSEHAGGVLGIEQHKVVARSQGGEDGVGSKRQDVPNKLKELSREK